MILFEKTSEILLSLTAIKLLTQTETQQITPVYIDRSYLTPGIHLGMPPANERRRYNVTTSLIGWAHT